MSKTCPMIHYDMGVSMNYIAFARNDKIHQFNNYEDKLNTLLKVWDSSSGSSISKLSDDDNNYIQDVYIHNLISFYCFNKYFNEKYKDTYGLGGKFPIILMKTEQESNDNNLKDKNNYDATKVADIFIVCEGVTK